MLGVLDITKFFGETTGGIKTYLLEKAAYVGRHPGLRQSVVIPGAQDDIRESNGVRWYRLRGRSIPTQAPYRFMLRRDAIREIVAREHPDIIEVGSPYAVPWIARSAARPGNIPLVWFYHTNLPRIISPRPERDPVHRQVLSRIASGYISRLANVFDAAIGASNAAVNELHAAGFTRVSHIPLGVALDHFHPSRRSRRAEVRSRFGLPDGPLAIFAGRLAREKELHLVIDAWPEVERETGAHLLLVGDGPSGHYFKRRSRAKNVTWLPYVSDRDRLADLVAASDIYLAPGPAETFGLAALEALASGIPVLSSDAGAVRELVEASGAGLVNPAPQVSVMARSVIQLFSQDLNTLGIRGRAYAEQHHDWQQVFDRIFQFYRQLMDEHHA
jgi:alpha-1,6-mannosyltransferase